MSDLGDLQPHDGAVHPEMWGIEHPRPFVVRLKASSDNVSRSVPHISNIEFVRWLDRAAELHADSVGQTRAKLLEAGMMWFVARHEIDYRAEAWPGDELLVATWVIDFQRVRSWRGFRIVRPADETIVCEAKTLWVLVDLATRKPKRIDHAVAALYDPLTGRRDAAVERPTAAQATRGGA